MLAAPAFAAPGAGQQAPELSVGKLDQAEGRRLVQEFREAGLPGSYYFEIELHILPRRGEEKILRGRMWGARNEQGPVTRIEVADEAGRPRRFLLQNGANPGTWRFADGRVAQLPVAELFSPLVAGVELTPFDVELPFLYWPDFTFESLARVAGRPTRVFLFRPPSAFASQFPQLSGVRAYFDTQYNAPVQTELLGRDGRPMKTISLVDAKRVGEQWLLKTIDARNEVTRDKTRLQLTGAALRLDFSSALFQPATLADDIKPPAADRIEHLGP